MWIILVYFLCYIITQISVPCQSGHDMTQHDMTYFDHLTIRHWYIHQFGLCISSSHEECDIPDHSWCHQREWNHPARAGPEALMPCGCCPTRKSFLLLVQEWEAGQILRSSSCHQEWPGTPPRDKQPRDNRSPFHWLWYIPVCGIFPRSTHPWPECRGEHFFRNR